MTQTPPRVRQRLLVVTLTALTTLGAGSVAAQSVSPSPVTSPGPGGEPIHEWLEVRPFINVTATGSE